MGAIDSFNYTEPAGGTKFRTYQSGGFHTQVVVIGDTDGANLPLHTTYGLSVDLKRIAAGAALSIADPADTEAVASVLDSDPDFDAFGLTVRLPSQQTVLVRCPQLEGLLAAISEQLNQLIGGISGWMGRDFPGVSTNRG